MSRPPTRKYHRTNEKETGGRFGGGTWEGLPSGIAGSAGVLLGEEELEVPIEVDQKSEETPSCF